MAYQPATVGNRSNQPFADRREAGQELAARLSGYRGRPDAVVLTLPRGGVLVAFEIAEALDTPLDIFVVRKLGILGHQTIDREFPSTIDKRQTRKSARDEAQERQQHPPSMRDSPARQNAAGRVGD